MTELKRKVIKACFEMITSERKDLGLEVIFYHPSSFSSFLEILFGPVHWQTYTDYV